LAENAAPVESFSISQAIHLKSAKVGPLKYRDVLGSIGVFDAPDNHMLIGMASCRTWDERGLAVWALTIHGRELSGRWVIIDRQFVPIESRQAPPVTSKP